MIGLSDHHPQVLNIKNIYATINKFPLKQRSKQGNKKHGNIYKYPTLMFDSFLFTFLNIFQSSFPVEYKSMKGKDSCIT
jgi:hypothetical protein